MTTTSSSPRVYAGRQQFFCETPDGLKWMLDANHAQDGLGPLHEQEPEGHSVHDFIMGSIPAGGVFLDVGSHVGHYALRAARKGARVYAVEANPDTAGRLAENIMLNELQGSVTIWALAAWDCWETLVLTPAEGPVRNGSQRVQRAVTAPPGDCDRDSLPIAVTVTVTGVPLDVTMAYLTRLDVVKLDVEGADTRALDGMHAMLCKLRPRVIIEDHSVLGYYDPQELRNAEARLAMDGGYEWSDIASHGVEGRWLNYRVGDATRG